MPTRSPAPVTRSARFSPCGRYRYGLTRRWAPGPAVVFVLLNPSTADARRDDPTIRRCMGFARAWGYGAVEVVNLCAWRATRPQDLRRAADALDPAHAALNRRAVLRAARRAERVVLAWGVHGAWRAAGAALIARLEGAGLGDRLVCLGTTQQGHPCHVLYLRRDTRPRRLPNRGK